MTFSPKNPSHHFSFFEPEIAQKNHDQDDNDPDYPIDGRKWAESHFNQFKTVLAAARKKKQGGCGNSRNQDENDNEGKDRFKKVILYKINGSK